MFWYLPARHGANPAVAGVKLAEPVGEGRLASSSATRARTVTHSAYCFSSFEQSESSVFNGPCSRRHLSTRCYHGMAISAGLQG